MTAKPKSNLPSSSPDKDATVILFDKLVATNPAIERKGATIPYTSLNGNMYMYLDNDGVVAMRLSEKDRESFIKKYNTTLKFSRGIVMKEYVAVPASLLKNTKELKKYFDLSYAYAKTLKAKPTTKTKAAKKTTAKNKK